MDKFKPLLLGAIFVAIAMAFAYAAPKSFNAASDPKSEVTPSPPEATPSPDSEETPEPDEDDDSDEEQEKTGAKADNHGRAVSTAAHCDIKGRAKGKLVSSIARDKDATVEDAEAACEAATAAAAAGAGEGKGKRSGPPPDRGKPDKGGKKPGGAPKGRGEDSGNAPGKPDEESGSGKPDGAGTRE